MSEALDGDNLGKIVEILKDIASAVDASGCTIWEVEPFADLKATPPTGNFYVFASGFLGEDMKIQKLPVNDCASGASLIKNKPINIEDIATHPDTYKGQIFSEGVERLTSMYVTPFCFNREGDKANATLAVYRRGEIRPFTKIDCEFIDAIARLIPKIYDVICDRVGRKLLAEINLILDEFINSQDNNQTDESKKKSSKNVREPLTDICRLIEETFKCVEASIFLQDRLIQDNIFRLEATNYPDWTSAKSEYLPDKSEGLTAWALAERQAICIFNLTTFREDKHRLWAVYPGVEWNDSLNFSSEDFQKNVRGILDLTKDAELPPLSFMAAPIIRKDDLLGVIRCCTAAQAPWFFPERHMRLLELIADPISDFFLHLGEREENVAWQELVEGINRLNDKFQRTLDSEKKKREFYTEILKLTERNIKGADILDIRLLDEITKELYFVEHLGDAWTEGGDIEFDKRFKTRFPLVAWGNSRERNNIGVEVLRSGTVQQIKDAETENYCCETFPETKRIIGAPIGVQDKTKGVLDIRGTGNQHFALNAPIMAELIGRELGLYLLLWEKDKQQNQVFEDTWHQLKSPVRNTIARANQLMKSNLRRLYDLDPEWAESLEAELKMLKGNASKANAVLANAGIFTELARTGTLKRPKEMTSMTLGVIRKLLYRIRDDIELLIEKYRNIEFLVDYDGFDYLVKINFAGIKANTDYLVQAVTCLMDNAGKYSYPDTAVVISVGVASGVPHQYFYIAVENRGLEITKAEIEKLADRNYRGKYAKLTTGEGSGIGLWVTDHIMKSHGGHLIIETTASRTTVARLLFPV